MFEKRESNTTTRYEKSSRIEYTNSKYATIKPQIWSESSKALERIQKQNVQREPKSAKIQKSTARALIERAKKLKIQIYSNL